MALILMAAYTNYRRDPRVKREAEAIIEAGHQVVFLAKYQAGEPDNETIAGVRVKKLHGITNDKTSAASYIIDYAIFFFAIFSHLIVRPKRYDLIHINNMPDFLVLATWPARIFGVPVVHDVHDLMPEIYMEKFGKSESHWLIKILKLQERWSAQFASAVLTVEERLRGILSLRGIRPEKIHVLMNLPDDRIFTMRKAAPDNGERFVMVYHGTLANRLGLDIAIRAVAKAVSQVPKLEFRIIGAGEEREKLIALRDELGLQQQVTFSDGVVPVERIPALIADADIGLIPLRISSGTDIMLPTKLLEYVAMGIPCTVPRTQTITRYFDSSMVMFFEAENPDSLAAAMVELYRKPQDRVALATAADQRFGQIYCWKQHKKVYTGLVERLLGNKRISAA